VRIKSSETKIKYDFIKILEDMILELISLIDCKSPERIHDLADACHNFPEFIMKEEWSLPEYWSEFIESYRQRWDKDFLRKWDP